MSTDRELLELAAKAAGIKVESWTTYGAYVGGLEGHIWNPLKDDGDALRLAVKLLIMPRFCSQMVTSGTESIGTNSARIIQEFFEDHKGDECAATRRAIVRAAAEIGKAMQDN